MDNAGVTAEQVDWVLLHQANIRIMETVAKKLGVPMDKVGMGGMGWDGMGWDGMGWEMPSGWDRAGWDGVLICEGSPVSPK